jgi:hypothetical protein
LRVTSRGLGDVYKRQVRPRSRFALLLPRSEGRYICEINHEVQSR